MVRFLMGALCPLCLGSSSLGALPAEERQPYKLTVVLRVARHPLLTDVFKENLQRELGDSLQDAFGNLAQVQVVDEHPLLSEIDKRGLQQALENFQGTEPIKTHFVLVDYQDGKYEIQARQYDGLTGLCSPLVRRARLEDPAGRPLVARTAALLIDRDFGLVGTVTDATNRRQVRVMLKGGKLGIPLEQRVQKDEVFAISQVQRLGGAQPVREALLQVVEPPDKDGVCVCRLLARFADPVSQLAGGAGVLGYRCLKLGTTEGHLRLRLINDKGLPHFHLQVQSSRTAFDSAQEKLQDQGFTGRDGFVQSRDKFRHVAFVAVLNGGTPIARLPVPILEDQVAVRTVTVRPDQERLSDLLFLRDRYVRRLDECLQVQIDLGKTLRELLGRSDHQGALEEARRARDRLQRDLRDLEAEHNSLVGEVDRARLAKELGATFLADGGRRQLLDQSLKELTDFIATWEKNQTVQARQQERDGLVARARLLKNREALYEEALKLYDEALTKFERTPQLAKERDELAAAWALKNQEGHRQARQFIYQVWPQLDSAAKILAHLEDARRHLAECKKVGDRLSPRRLLALSTQQAKLLDKERSGLSADREDDRAKIETIQKAAEGLRQLYEDVNAFVGGK